MAADQHHAVREASPAGSSGSSRQRTTESRLDRFSALDLTFAVGVGMTVEDVLCGWTRTLVDEADAVHLADLRAGPPSTACSCFPTRSVRPVDDAGGASSGRQRRSIA